MQRPPVLVWGASGFTGNLICEALERRGIPFAAAGRNQERVDAIAKKTGATESLALDLKNADALNAAIRDRTIVCACAGPFAEIGEPVLAACARLGVSYVDTTGEQTFVAMSRARYQASAEASGACIVSAMAFEIALSDFCAHLAFEALGTTPDEIACVYALRGGYVDGTTPATKRSAIGMASVGESKQWVDGVLRDEPVATIVREFTLENGKRKTGFSFPSPEAIDVPTHTGARTVRAFMISSPTAANALHLFRDLVSPAIRLAAPVLERLVDRAPRGPSEDVRRTSSFEVFAEARAKGATKTVRVTGTDPYGLTGELQAWAAARAIESKLPAGVLAPSAAFPARLALDSLAEFGLSVHEDGPLAT